MPDNLAYKRLKSVMSTSRIPSGEKSQTATESEISLNKKKKGFGNYKQSATVSGSSAVRG